MFFLKNIPAHFFESAQVIGLKLTICCYYINTEYLNLTPAKATLILI